MEVTNSAGAIDPTAARIAATQRSEPVSVARTGFQKLIDQATQTDVWSEVDAAGRVAEDMHARGRELHFEALDGGKVSIQVKDLDGRVLRSLPTGDVVDVAAGKVAV